MMAREYIELHDQMVNCAGYEILGRMKYRRFKVEIFKANVAEVRAFLENLPDEHFGSNELIDRGHIEINRLFQNFLAGAAILIDQTRVFMKDYYAGTPLAADYQSLINQHLAQDKLCKFVKDLRNYATHNTLPVHYFKNTVERGVLRRSFAIGVKQLRAWDNWTKESAAYLALQTSDIELIAVVEPYTAKIMAFHDLLDAAITNFHADELTEYMQIRAAYETAKASLKLQN